MTDRPTPLRNRWLVVLSCFLGLLLCISPFFQFASGIILAPMADGFGWSRGQLAMGPSLASLVVALFAPFVGWWVDRRGARIVALAGCIGMPMFIMLLGVIPASFSLYLFVTVLIGIAGAATIPSVYLYNLPPLFERQLGLAISLSVIGLGIGQIVMPLLTAAALANCGWRMAWVFMGGLILLVGVANVILLVPRASSDVRSSRPQLHNLDGVDFGEALRTPSCWLLAFAFFLIAMVTNGTALHLVGVLSSNGFSHRQATFAVSAIGIGSIVARLSSGLLIDWFGVRLPAALFLGGQAAGCLLLTLNIGNAPSVLGVMLIGAGLGAESDIMPYILRRKYGMRAFGRVYSFSFSALAIGSAVGPAAMGFSADITHSYSSALFVFAGAALVAMALILLLAPRRAQSHRVPALGEAH